MVALLEFVPFDREAAVRYAHRWAYQRNPEYYDYENLGGNCTAFASAATFAGSGVMNYTPTYGWYYIDANDKAPAWTGVEYFYNFMTRGERSPGPAAVESTLEETAPGDVVQISFDGVRFAHTVVVVSVGTPAAPSNILIAANSEDADYRPLNTYQYKLLRTIHFIGTWRIV